MIIVAALVVSAGAAGFAIRLALRPERDTVAAAIHQPVGAEGVALGLAWVLTGAALGWLRPRNALGWLLLGLGTCQTLAVVATLYGGYGVVLGGSGWPLARWSAWLASGIGLPALLPLTGVLLALYPDGRLPGPRWRWPVAASIAGIAIEAVTYLLSQDSYNDIAPGRSPLALKPSPLLDDSLTVLTAALIIGGTVTIWLMSAVRVANARSPERQQLAWLLAVVVPVFLVIDLADIPTWVDNGVACLMPAAIAVGALRYNLLGLEAVLRRGLVYGTLTGAILASFLLATLAASFGLGQRPVTGAIAAAVVAVGLSPFRERLQRAVDRFVYGERRDPMRAVTRLGESVAATEETDLLTSVLTSVTDAVHAPGAMVLGPLGRVRATTGTPALGEDFPLAVSGHDVGTLRVAARSSGEQYGAGERRLLAALTPQVAVVVRALDLAEALESERDRVLAATRLERNRLRRDLHDGLGPSLSGVGLSLRALEDALNNDDVGLAGELNRRTREEVQSAVGEVRRIIDDLRPAPLADGDLAAALRRQAAVSGATYPVHVAVSQNLPHLPAEVEAAAYRITQEALTNAVKHASASQVSIAIDADDRDLRVLVMDDGRGLSGSLEDHGGLGLTSMRYRAEVLGGTLTLDSDAGGTTVTALLPLRLT
jgi:signal transduction histidine kinase